MSVEPATGYTVSPQLLERSEFQEACAAHDFAQVFKLMRKYDGASQDRIASPIRGLTQSRVSRIVGGKDRISSLDLVARISDSLRIPGGMLGLASRPWEDDAPNAITPSLPLAAVQATHAAGEVAELRTVLEIDIAEDGWATLTYRRQLRNDSDTPYSRLFGELWFEHTDGPLRIEPTDDCTRTVLVQRIHDTALQAKFACQFLPAIAPGEQASIGYAAKGGRFVSDHFWRQGVTRPTAELTIRLRHHGVTTLSRCSGLEERADGSEVSATESITLLREDDGVVIELTRRNLRPNQSVTLRWDTPRD